MIYFWTDLQQHGIHSLNRRTAWYLSILNREIHLSSLGFCCSSAPKWLLGVVERSLFRQSCTFSYVFHLASLQMLTNAPMFTRVVPIWLVRTRLDRILAHVTKDSVWTKEVKAAQVIHTYMGNFQKSKTANDRGFSLHDYAYDNGGLISKPLRMIWRNKASISSMAIFL